jgi:hypothetical protein
MRSKKRVHHKKMSRRTLHITIEILIFAMLTAASAVLFFPVQKELIKNITEVRDSLIARAEEKFNKSFYYSSMGPSIFGTFDLRDISIYEHDAPHEEENALLSVKRIRIKYSLWDIINGLPQSAVHSVIIDKPALRISFDRDAAELFKNIMQKEHEDKTGTEVDPFFSEGSDNLITTIHEFINELPEGFNIRLNKGLVHIAAQESSVSLQSFSFNSYKRDRNLTLKADWKAEAAIKGEENDFFTISIPGKADGHFSLDTVHGEFNVFLPETSTDLFKINQIRFTTIFTRDYISIQKIADENPYDIYFIAYFEGQEVSAKLSTDNFSLSNIITLRGKLSPYNIWLATRLKGTVLFEKGSKQGIRYTANLSGRLHSKSPLGDGSFGLDVNGNENIVHIRDLQLAISRGKLSYTGSFAFNPVSPDGILRVEEFYFGENGRNGTSSPVSGEFALTSNTNRISIFADELKIANTVFNALDIEALRRKNNYPISLSAIRYNNVESYEDVSVSLINAEANFDVLKNNFSATGRVNALALNDMLNLAGIVLEFPKQNDVVKGFSEDISITTEFSFQTNFKNISWSVPRLILAYHGLTDIIAVSSLSGTDKIFELSECHIGAGEGIDITAKADYTNLNNIIFSMESIINNTPYQFEGSLQGKKNLAITGPSGFLVNAVINPNGSLEGSCSIDSLLIPTISKNATLSLDSIFNVVSNDKWSVEINSLDIHNLLSSGNASHISAHGSINQERVYFPELIIDDGRDLLRGEVRFYFNGPLLPEDSNSGSELVVNLGNSSGTERIALEGGFQDGGFYGHLAATNFKISRFFLYSSNMLVNGLVDLSFEADGTYNAIFSLDSLTGRFGSNDLSLTGRGSLNQGGIEIGETHARFAGWTADFPFISLERESSRIETTVSIRGSTGKRALSADLSILCNFAKIDSWLDVSGAIKELTGSVNVTNAHLLDPAMPEQFDFEFSKQENIIAISGGPDDMLDSQIDSAGAFYLDLASPSPVIGTITGEIKNNNIYADTSNIYIDLKKLWIYFPDEIHVIECTGGFALADIHISGNMLDPNMYGIARGYGVRMAVPDFLSAEIGPAPVTLHLKDDEMSFEPFLAPVGKGKGFVTGSFYFDRWIISDYNINIEAAPDTPIPYAVDIVGISANGLASGTISLALNDTNNLVITGDITGSNSIITLDMLSPEEQQAAVDALAGDGEMNTQTDITIHAGNKVEFLWPNRNNPVLRATADVGDTFRITGNTLSGASSLVGNIGLRGGELFYFQRSFYIREGELVFRENEINFNPRISAVAETRDQSNEGPVTISIILDNQSLLSFTPVIQSDPPLSQVEILSILGNTMTGPSDEETEQYLRPFLASTTDVLAQFLLVRRAETRLRDLLHVDMFSARTQAIQNAIFDTVLTPAEKRETSAWNYFDNTTLFVGKYITRDLFVQSMMAAAYDRNQIANNGLSFDLFIGVELSSPLFNIRAEMNPDVLSTQNLWIPTAKISLSRTWRLP